MDMKALIITKLGAKEGSGPTSYTHVRTCKNGKIKTKLATVDLTLKS
jgi:hypothetical protein